MGDRRVCAPQPCGREASFVSSVDFPSACAARRSFSGLILDPLRCGTPQALDGMATGAGGGGLPGCDRASRTMGPIPSGVRTPAGTPGPLLGSGLLRHAVGVAEETPGSRDNHPPDRNLRRVPLGRRYNAPMAEPLQIGPTIL